MIRAYQYAFGMIFLEKTIGRDKRELNIDFHNAKQAGQEYFNAILAQRGKIPADQLYLPALLREGEQYFAGNSDSDLLSDILMCNYGFHEGFHLVWQYIFLKQSVDTFTALREADFISLNDAGGDKLYEDLRDNIEKCLNKGGKLYKMVSAEVGNSIEDQHYAATVANEVGAISRTIRTCAAYYPRHP